MLCYPPGALNAHEQISQSALSKGTPQTTCLQSPRNSPPSHFKLLGSRRRMGEPPGSLHWYSAKQSEGGEKKLLPPDPMVQSCCLGSELSRAWGVPACSAGGLEGPLTLRPGATLPAAPSQRSEKLWLQVPASGRTKGLQRLPGKERAKSVRVARPQPRQLPPPATPAGQGARAS